MSSSRPAAPVAVPRVVNLNAFADSRGTLVAADGSESLPFPPVRYFLIHGVPAGATRGGHALRHGQELLSCVAGACTVELRWDNGHMAHRLADPGTALHLPPWVWVECREFSEDAVLLVLCSEPYDLADQIADIAEFEAGPAPAA
jgi:dTDP-4-dehydrorhamnose 3,5-epimerase-like enzyme